MPVYICLFICHICTCYTCKGRFSLILRNKDYKKEASLIFAGANSTKGGLTGGSNCNIVPLGVNNPADIYIPK